jgi:hypothetical protein
LLLLQVAVDHDGSRKRFRRYIVWNASEELVYALTGFYQAASQRVTLMRCGMQLFLEQGIGSLKFVKAKQKPLDARSEFIK